jgi:hypothetical protein
MFRLTRSLRRVIMELEQRIKGQTGGPAFVVAAAGIGLVLHPIERSFPELLGQPPAVAPFHRSQQRGQILARERPHLSSTKRGAIGGANAAKLPCH